MIRKEEKLSIFTKFCPYVSIGYRGIFDQKNLVQIGEDS